MNTASDFPCYRCVGRLRIPGQAKDFDKKEMLNLVILANLKQKSTMILIPSISVEPVLATILEVDSSGLLLEIAELANTLTNKRVVADGENHKFYFPFSSIAWVYSDYSA